MAKIQIFIYCNLFFFPVVAFAYIDPGSASYFIQALIAAISAGLIYIRHPIDTIKRVITKFFKK
jgi:hypothetical protein